MWQCAAGGARVRGTARAQRKTPPTSAPGRNRNERRRCRPQRRRGFRRCGTKGLRPPVSRYCAGGADACLTETLRSRLRQKTASPCGCTRPRLDGTHRRDAANGRSKRSAMTAGRSPDERTRPGSGTVRRADPQATLRRRAPTERGVASPGCNGVDKYNSTVRHRSFRGFFPRLPLLYDALAHSLASR